MTEFDELERLIIVEFPLQEGLSSSEVSMLFDYFGCKDYDIFVNTETGQQFHRNQMGESAELTGLLTEKKSGMLRVGRASLQFNMRGSYNTILPRYYGLKFIMVPGTDSVDELSDAEKIAILKVKTDLTEFFSEFDYAKPKY